MSERFHVKVDLGPGQVLIDGPEAHHLGTVCRVRTGDPVCLFNGDGHEYPGVVTSVSRREVVVEVRQRQSPRRESPIRLHLVAALPKGDRAAFMVEKLTELGVSVLTLLVSERSVVQPREGKVDKLERHVIEASKQCGRNTLMQIEAARPWAEVLADARLPQHRYIAHPYELGQTDATPGGPIDLQGAKALTVAVGPEGGFTDAEVGQAVAAGWQRISLGPRILRVETAALAAASWLLWGG